ncbi:c-type cytochrome [Hyphomicrobium denitrificans]|uniref:c-type cytochrome n=1 Tax=Hyphomicrobium denitrificans TaxID=53399 RepID=UPI001FCA69F9|nr:cytochrome c [Hyphomicrobium denitrificans]
MQSCCAAFALVVCTLTVVPISPTSANAKPLGAADVPSGKDLFIEHCAQCHGNDGTGNGPKASTLKVKPADLTTLSKRANGKFDAARVADIIRFGGDISEHGTRAMPIWSLIFSNEAHGGKSGAAYSRRAVIELKTYLQSIQKK